MIRLFISVDRNTTPLSIKASYSSEYNITINKTKGQIEVNVVDSNSNSTNQTFNQKFNTLLTHEDTISMSFGNNYHPRISDFNYNDFFEIENFSYIINTKFSKNLLNVMNNTLKNNLSNIIDPLRTQLQELQSNLDKTSNELEETLEKDQQSITELTNQRQILNSNIIRLKKKIVELETRLDNKETPKILERLEYKIKNSNDRIEQLLNTINTKIEGKIKDKTVDEKTIQILIRYKELLSQLNENTVNNQDSTNLISN